MEENKGSCKAKKLIDDLFCIDFSETGELRYVPIPLIYCVNSIVDQTVHPSVINKEIRRKLLLEIGEALAFDEDQYAKIPKLSAWEKDRIITVLEESGIPLRDDLYSVNSKVPTDPLEKKWNGLRLGFPIGAKKEAIMQGGIVCDSTINIYVRPGQFLKSNLSVAIDTNTNEYVLNYHVVGWYLENGQDQTDLFQGCSFCIEDDDKKVLAMNLIFDDSGNLEVRLNKSAIEVYPANAYFKLCLDEVTPE